MEKMPLKIPVVPLVPLPFKRSPIFSYTSAESIPPGSIVSVSFGPRVVCGVVWDEIDRVKADRVPRRAIRYKPIRDVLDASALSEPLRRTAEYIADRYFTPLGRVLEAMLAHADIPKGIRLSKPKRTAPSLETEPKETPLSKWMPISFGTAAPTTLSPHQRQAVREIFTMKSSPIYLYGPAGSGKSFVYWEAIRRTLKKDGQALILVPNQLAVLFEETRYPKIFGRDTIGIFHAGLTESNIRELSRDIRSGKKRIIIGTRQALFLPFRKLSLIILDDEGHMNMKQTAAAPRFDARRVAEILGNASGARVLFGSSAPSMDEYISAKIRDTLVTLPSRSNVRVETINLRIERWKKRFAPISNDLAETIRDRLTRKEQILLMVGRSGMSAFSVCAACKEIFRCPLCTRPYRYEREGFFRCLTCGSKTDETPSCPHCHSLEFRHVGIGTERVERDLERRFPGTRLVRLDEKNLSRKDTLKRFQEFLDGKRSILITTPIGIRGWSLPQLSLVAMIDADAGFGFPAWNADEEAFQTLLQASGCASLSKHGLMVLQTFHPENRLFLTLGDTNIEEFFASMSDGRETLLYPPFANLIRLRHETSSAASLEKETKRLKEKLEAIRDLHPRSFRFQTFSTSTTWKKKKKIFSQEILLRIARIEKPPKEFQTLRMALKALLTDSLSCWIIDVDPLH